MKKIECYFCNISLYKFLLNVLIIYLAASIYPSYIRLGNSNIYNIAALIVTALALTFIQGVSKEAKKRLNLKIKNDWVWIFIYAVINSIGLWLLARGANYTGFGIVSSFIAVVLGTVLALVQYLVRKVVFPVKKEEKRKKKR